MLCCFLQHGSNLNLIKSLAELLENEHVQMHNCATTEIELPLNLDLV